MSCLHFYPRPPRGGRHELRLISGCRFLFLSTPSARRATHRCAGGLNVQADFYPRPPRGGRRFVEFFIGKLAEFLSTPSARRATKAQDLKRAIELISIHALREEGDGCAFSGHRSDTISIHALREEGDTAATWHRRPPSNFYPRPPRGGRHAGEALRVGSVIISIHALREEGDLIRLLCMANSAIFLSTPSARRATAQLAALTAELEDFYPRPPRGGRPSTPPPWSSVAHFYPRPPRGGRPALPGDLLVLFFISIHALREEGDYFANSAKYQITLFLSTPSARRATRAATGVKADILFLSTPSARRATYAPCIFRPCRRFLSTPSARRATIVQQQGGWGKLFLSTPSARRATGAAFLAWWGAEFLSTPSARRATQASNKSHRPKPFLSTPSARRATESGTSLDKASPISIHALREEGDRLMMYSSILQVNFYPRPPRGGRLARCRCPARAKRISIHALREEGD